MFNKNQTANIQQNGAVVKGKNIFLILIKTQIKLIRDYDV